MNITFLIGNGFDLNIGLHTTYLDFINEYKKLEPNPKALKRFHVHLQENMDLWANAEIALGKYTSQFERGQAKEFADCHEDINNQLGQYLAMESRRVSLSKHSDLVSQAFSNLTIPTMAHDFPGIERERFMKKYTSNDQQPTIYNFINYNYTRVLDDFLSIVKCPQKGHFWQKNTIGEICHVHGAINDGMIFGVNDESQIAKPDIFDDCKHGDIYRNLLIKQKANFSLKKGRDEKAAKLLQDSDLIYIYGMSIGETDKLWWTRLCDWLRSGKYVIVQKHEMPTREKFPRRYLEIEQEVRGAILKHSSFTETERKETADRIHVTGENIFAAINNIANVKSSYAESASCGPSCTSMCVDSCSGSCNGTCSGSCEDSCSGSSGASCSGSSNGTDSSCGN